MEVVREHGTKRKNDTTVYKVWEPLFWQRCLSAGN